MTLKALLQPEALARLGTGEYLFCSTDDCSIVYYGPHDSFRCQDVLVPVFQKETAENRTVCYCFAVSESMIRDEVEALGVSPSADRIRALVKAGSCACEVRNPQGTCCLGNVVALTKPSARERKDAAGAVATSAPHE